MRFKTVATTILGAAVLAALAAPTPALAQANEQFIPITIYRTGPYANTGAPVMQGFMDYMALLNERDSGVGGVKLVWEECETAYQPDRMVECYERLKGKGPTGASFFNTLGTGLAYAVLERAHKDKIPIITLGYGRTDATDGRVWPYAFPLIQNYWSQSTAKIKFIGMKEGGMDKLKGKKIANVHHDSAYGKETIPVLNKQAEMYGFEVKHYSVAHPGIDQKATWLLVRQSRPDWVIVRGWGVMNQVSIKEGAAVGFPREKMIGVYWSGSEQDTVPAGDAAKGYISVAMHAPGKDFPVIQEILKHVYAKGKGTGDPKDIGTVMWNRGVIHGLVNLEAIIVAQGRYGKKPLTGEQIRWGFENLNFSPERVKALGADGLLPPFKTSCLDHEGQAPLKFQQWDGTKWAMITDWITTDQSIVRPMIEESAAAYAKEKGITPRDCAKES
ncbi:MAG: ABC transporter substrate-binding protein [Pseudomonadota bacterium]